MKKNYENPNVKVAFFRANDVISLSNDLEVDFKNSNSDQVEEININ